MVNETGNPYGRPEEIPGAATGADGWPQPAQAPGSSGGWGQQAQQQAPNPWGQQAPQQPPNSWGQQQGYAQPQPPQYPAQQYQGQQYQAQQTYTPQQQYQGQQPPPPQPPRDGLTANPFALPGQDAYAGYTSRAQGQPVNPYAATPLGINADAKRDDQTWLERTGLSKGKAVWLGVLLVAAAGFFTYDKFFSTDPATAKVGGCLHIGDSTYFAYDAKTVSCTDPTADAKVLAKFDGTTDKSKCDPYTVPGGSILPKYGKSSYVLCLAPLNPAPADGSSPTSAG